jgi:carboxylesterase type B
VGNISAYDVFFGVPYAQPPVDELRLEKPVMVEPYSALLDCSNYTKMRPCPFGVILPALAILGVPATEDCLKLNIIRPAGISASSSLPVLVYIHGGGYTFGGALSNEPQRYPDIPTYYVSQGIVVVQIQYRLSLLGFGSDGSRALPGNLGLFDQQLALRWVHENIGAFGGNPDNVTIFGISAGATSVSFHTIQPNSSTHFQRAVAMSGSFNSPWAFSNVSLSYTRAVADAVGCAGLHGATLKQCLKNTSMAAIQNATNAIHPSTRASFAFTTFSPRYDGDFFRGDFDAMVAAAEPKPSMIGFNSDESFYWTCNLANPAIQGTPNGWSINGSTASDYYSYSSGNLTQFIQQNILPAGPSSLTSRHKIRAIRRRLAHFYAVEESLDGNASSMPAYYFRQYSRLISDVEFIVPALWEARRKAQKQWPVHLYHFSHVDAALAAILPYPAVAHGTDGPYDIGGAATFYNKYPFDSADVAVRQTLLSAMVAFVKDGEPGTDSGATWPLLNFSGNGCGNATRSYLAENVNAAAFVEGGASEVARRLGFWDQLSAAFDIGIVSNFPNTMGQCVPGRD